MAVTGIICGCMYGCAYDCMYGSGDCIIGDIMPGIIIACGVAGVAAGACGCGIIPGIPPGPAGRNIVRG